MKKYLITVVKPLFKRNLNISTIYHKNTHSCPMEKIEWPFWYEKNWLFLYDKKAYFYLLYKNGHFAWKKMAILNSKI